MQTTTTLHRQWTKALTTENDTNDVAATKITGNDADNDNAAAEVNAAMKMMR